MNLVDYNLARDTNTPAETLAQLAQQSFHIGILREIAQNRRTSPETLAYLAQHAENRYFIDVVAQNPNTSPETLAQLAQHPTYKSIQLQIARNPSTSPETLAELAQQSADMSVIIYLTANPNLPSGALTYLAQQPRYKDILSLIARHPNIPSATLEQLVQQATNTSVLAVIAGNPQTPPDVLTQLAQQSSDMGVLREIAGNPSTPSHLLPDLWFHPRVVEVRAADPNPRDFAGYDASDEDALYSLESSIARHPNLPQATEAELTQLDSDWNFGKLVLFDRNAAPQVLQVLGRTRQHDAELVHHRNTPSSMLEMLACRVSTRALGAIQNHPNRTPLAAEIIVYRQGQGNASQAALDLLAQYGTRRE
jgi:DNA-binding IscR family transcriptional regulator